MLPFQRFEKTNTKDNLWIYILILLKEEGVLHAWDIQNLVEKKFGFKPGKITPYRVLYRLEEDKMVSSQNKERRRMYKITLKGEEELKKTKGFLAELLKKIK